MAAITGGLLYYYGEPSTSYSLRDGFLTVSSIWILVSFFAALPFYFGGVLPSFIDALFESVSGITATGASVVPDIDALPQSYVLWRSLTHWLGGMGIVVLVLAFLKNLGADSAHLLTQKLQYQDLGLYCLVFDRWPLNYGRFTCCLRLFVLLRFVWLVWDILMR